METYHANTLAETLGNCVDVLVEILKSQPGGIELDEGYGSPGQQLVASSTSTGSSSVRSWPKSLPDPLRLHSLIVSCKFCLDNLSASPLSKASPARRRGASSSPFSSIPSPSSSSSHHHRQHQEKTTNSRRSKLTLVSAPLNNQQPLPELSSQVIQRILRFVASSSSSSSATGTASSSSTAASAYHYSSMEYTGSTGSSSSAAVGESEAQLADRYRRRQREIYSASLVSRQWNDAATIILWDNPYLSSRATTVKFVLCARITSVRMEYSSRRSASPVGQHNLMLPSPSSPTTSPFSAASTTGSSSSSPSSRSLFKASTPLLSWHTRRLDLSIAKLRDPADVSLFCAVLQVCPNTECIKWGANPISESTLYQMFKLCGSLNTLSISGPIIAAKKSVVSALLGSPYLSSTATTKINSSASPSKVSESIEMLNTTKETAYFEVIQEGLGRLKVLELLDMDDDLSLDSVSKPTVVESPLAQRKLGSMDMLSSGSGAMKATLPPSSSVFTDSAPSHLKKNNRMSIQVSSVRAQDEEQQQTPSQATSKRDKRQSNIFSLVGLGSALSNSPTPMSEAEMKLEGLLPSNNNAASLSNASSSAANKRSNRQSSMFALGSGPVVVPHQDALQEFSSTTRGSVMMIESSLVSPPTSKRDKRQSTLFGLGGSSNNLSSSMPSLKKSVPDLQISSLSAHNSESVRKAVEEQVERLREAAVSAATPMLTESVQALCSPMVRDFPRLLRSSLSPVMESLVLSGAVSTDLVVNIARRTSPGLVHAVLHDCAMLEDRAAILLAANSGTTLRVISLRGCTSITDSAVGEIVSWCPILEVLDLTRTKITDMGIWAINSKCAIREGEGVGVATTASLSGKKSLGAAAASIDKFSNSGSSFRGLKALYLDHTLVCADGSQALISFISRGGARLEDLSLLNCHILSDQHSVELIEALLRFAPNLVRLDARNTIVPALRPVEEALEKLVSSRNLKTLNVGGIGLETSEFIEKVSTMLPAEGVKLITPNW